MASTRNTALERLIDSVEPIVTMEREGLVIVALGATTDAAGPTYLTLNEATGAGAVDIHELGDGAVPTVAVQTKDQPVVIFGGDTIVGGKQNRIVNVTIWLTAMQTTQIPVTCLEHGRWDPGAEMRFASARTDSLESPAVGEGTDVRFETDRITGAALIREGRVVHAEVHRVA